MAVYLVLSQFDSPCMVHRLRSLFLLACVRKRGPGMALFVCMCMCVSVRGARTRGWLCCGMCMGMKSHEGVSVRIWCALFSSLYVSTAERTQREYGCRLHAIALKISAAVLLLPGHCTRRGGWCRGFVRRSSSSRFVVARSSRAVVTATWSAPVTISMMSLEVLLQAAQYVDRPISRSGSGRGGVSPCPTHVEAAATGGSMRTSLTTTASAEDSRSSSCQPTGGGGAATTSRASGGLYAADFRGTVSTK